jgi:amino acid transporter
MRSFYLGILLAAMATGIGRAVALTVLIWGLGLLNLAGVRYGVVVNLLTVVKLIPLLLFVGVGLFFVDGSRYQILTVPDLTSLRQASLALISAGGSRTRQYQPKRSRTRLITFNNADHLDCTDSRVIHRNPDRGIGNAAGACQRPDATSFRGSCVFGPRATPLTLAVFSTMAASVRLLVGLVLYSLAEGGQLPGLLARIHPRHRTPHIAVILFALAAWVIALYGNFAQLVMVSAIARLLFSATTCLAVPVLRRKTPNAKRTFRVPGGIAIPALAAVISIWLLTGINKAQAIAGVVALLVGAVLYLLVRRPAKRIAA